MSLAKTFLKHRFIIEQLRRRPQKLIELNATWKDSEDNVEGGELLQRTLQRDIHVIREVYNIEIKCNRSTNEYEITEDNDLYTQNLLEAFDVFRALQNYGNLSEVIQFEKRLPAGTEYLSPLLRAIKEKRQVALHYYKFWDKNKQPVVRTLEPYLLKEAQRRWYVLAWDVEKEALRVFGLDRIKHLDDQRGVKFQHPVPEEVEHFFDDSFGAWVDNERTQAEEVVLAFKKLPTDSPFVPNPAEYLKAMPLHPSQELMSETEDEIVLKLHLKITPDFVKEIQSYGSRVEWR
ncbi:WYL domain-containing protein [Capnocytophaga sputigena]|uniref:helix-turn-helix transcriptional regulator n=1 Tax=Capnocytophaga sputigena TaxID=1019 RepID=UPI0028D50F10|nr:WYL domain-containing protein [Capnocytophaga sputigena]